MVHAQAHQRRQELSTATRCRYREGVAQVPKANDDHRALCACATWDCELTGAGPAGASRVHQSRVVPIIWYSSIGYDQPAAAAFTRKYHVRIEIEHNATGAALTQIEASLNNPK